MAPPEVVDPFVVAIAKLMGDAQYYATAARDARERGVAFIKRHEDRLGAMLEEDLEALRGAPECKGS